MSGEKHSKLNLIENCLLFQRLKKFPENFTERNRRKQDAGMQAFCSVDART